MFLPLIKNYFFKLICLGLILFCFSSKLVAQKLPLWEGYEANEKIQLVHYFATWCKPCMQELPIFDTLRNLYSSEKIEFTFVCMDMKNSNKLRKEISRLNLPGSVYFLEPSQNAIQLIHPNWIGSIPTTTICFQNVVQNQFVEGAKNVLFYRNLLEK